MRRSFVGNGPFYHCTQYNLVDDENVEPDSTPYMLLYRSDSLFRRKKNEKFFPHLGGGYHFKFNLIKFYPQNRLPSCVSLKHSSLLFSKFSTWNDAENLILN